MVREKEQEKMSIDLEKCKLGTCKKCTFYIAHTQDNGWGSCSHKRVAEGDFTHDCKRAQNPLVEGGGDDGYGDYIHMKPDFGCILFEAKK